MKTKSPSKDQGRKKRRKKATKPPERVEYAEPRDFPALDRYERDRKAVCKRCKVIMMDCEPASGYGEFYHVARVHQTRAKSCVNAGQRFNIQSVEVEPFMRKARRRALKRMGIRA